MRIMIDYTNDYTLIATIRGKSIIKCPTFYYIKTGDTHQTIEKKDVIHFSVSGR